MAANLWTLYALMLKSRLFEETVTYLWRQGLISGEMHLGTGEEGIAAGVVSHLQDGDAMALDHRGTPPLLMRGVDPVLLLREMLGFPDGLCGGNGGHMHLFSKSRLAASSGIVGAAGPAAAGFALAAQYLRPGRIAVAFFGDGAINQGMLLETLNLAAAWELPVLFVCKDDSWAITTRSSQMTGGNLRDRARGFGIRFIEADGRDPALVWKTAREAVGIIRAGGGPVFLCARCVHLEAHFLGYQLARATRDPIRELPHIVAPLAQSFISPGGARLSERLAGLKIVLTALLETLRDPRKEPENDPIAYTRARLLSEPDRLQVLEETLAKETEGILSAALVEVTI